MKLRVGLVGLGSAWETRHLPALRALADRFEVRAICEPVAHRAALAAKEFGAAQVDGFRALAAREDVDGVLLLSAQWYGSLPILAACEAGKAVYCADALKLAVDQARHIKSHVEQAGIAFVAELPKRLSPATLRLKELVATQLGAPQLLFCHRRRRAGSAGCEPASWVRRDLIESVDWCRYVVGQEPTSVVGLAHRSPDADQGDDYQMLSLDFSPAEGPGSGAVAHISSGRYLPAHWQEAISFRPPAAMQVVCAQGVAFIDLPATLTWFDQAGRHMESLESERPVGEQLLLSFYRAATSFVRDTSSLEDAYRALRIVVNAQESHAGGKRVPIELNGLSNTP